MEPHLVVLDGEHLTINQVVSIAKKRVRVKIAEQARKRVQAARDFVVEQVNTKTPIYGFNRGVGLNKDQVVESDQFENYNRSLILSHCVAVGPEALEEEVRAAMLIRLNTLLLGYTGVQVGIVDMLQAFLNNEISPIIHEKGSIGAADIGCLAFVGLTMIGEGAAYYKGVRLPAREVLDKSGLRPIKLGPKDGLAIVSSNAFAAGKAALLVHESTRLVNLADLVYAFSLEGLDGNVTPLNEKVVAARRFSGQKASAANVRHDLKGSYLWGGHQRINLQDPLSFRGAFSVHGSVRDALNHVREMLIIQMNATEDNPAILIDEKRMISNANYEITSLINGVEMLGIALAHLSKISCYRTVKLSSPAFTGLTRFLVPERHAVLGFATIQKTFAVLDAEIRHLCQPASVDFFPLAGDIEDHGTNSIYVIQKTAKIVDNLYYILAIEMIHAAQAIDLRGKIQLGAGTERLYRSIRLIIPFLDKDRDLSIDIEKAYALAKNDADFRNAACASNAEI